MLDLWLELFMSYTNLYINIGEKSLASRDRMVEVVMVMVIVGLQLSMMLCITLPLTSVSVFVCLFTANISLNRFAQTVHAPIFAIF